MDTSSMKNCVDEFVKSHPEGRSKKKKSKQNAYKQAAAACHQTMGTSKNEGETFTFIDFLSEIENHE